MESLEARQLLTVTANPDIYVALQNTPLIVAAPGVLSNDATNTGTALTVANFTQPTKGTLTLNPNGSFSYTPNAGAFGADQFAYTVADAKGGTATSTVQFQVNATTDEASVFAGSRLANIDSTQSTVLNAVLGGLVGTNLNLTAADYNGLAASTINGGRLANALGAELGVTPDQALTTNATLGQILTAAATVAQTDGNTAEVNALQGLAASVGGLPGTVQLGNLIQANTADGSLSTASLNALDLVTGSIQLFNFDNVLTTPAPITVSAAALGLPGIVTGVTISPQVVEPPVLTTGPAGTQFHTSAIRLRIDLNLNSTLTTTTLAPVLNSLGFAADANLNQLSIYTEVAEGQGTIASVDAIAQAVTLQATPGLADVYLGNIADNVFFDRNRTRVIDPATDVNYATVGTLDLTNALIPVLNQSVGIQLKGSAIGDSPTAKVETFTAPFPQSQTVSTDATFLTNLASSLASSLSVQFSGPLAGTLNPVTGALLDLVSPLVTSAVTPVLAPVLNNVADPVIQSLGAEIGQLDLTVNAVTRVGAPAANADFATTELNQAIVVPVLANDAALAGDPITLASVTQPAHGAAVVNTDGTVTYTPMTGYIGPDTFTYTITDPNGLTSTAAVTINVQPLPPQGNPDTYTATENAPLTVPVTTGVLANDTDPAGSPLTAVVETNPTRGTVALNPDGSFTYTPTAGTTGPDTFTYRATDGTVFSAPVIVTVNVQPIPPVANPDTYTATVGTPLTVPVATGVLANDTDPNGLTLTAAVVTQPTHGTVTLNPDGSLVYTPTAGYIGPDTFTYQATDSSGASTPATVSINVQAAGLPVANPDTYTTTTGTPLTVPVGTGVLANDTDPNGLTLTAAVATQPTHGTVTLNPDGSLVYTPTAGYIGPDTFTYQATDSSGASTPATVSINVQAAGLPVANPDTYTTTTGTPLTVPVGTGVLANDTDPNGLTLTAAVATQPTHGTVTLNPDGSLVYTPTAGYIGPDTFTYQATDTSGTSTPATVSINVAAGSGGGGGGGGGTTTPQPPQVVMTFPITGTEGIPIVSVPVVTFTDGDGSTPPGSYTATINFGDGTTPAPGTVTETNGVYEVLGDHTYAHSGTYPVSVTIARAGSAGLTAATAATIAPAAANASLSGFVYADANSDASKEAGEVGVAGAVIILAGTSTSGQVIYHVTTTALNGSYSFGGLPAGTYAIAERGPSGVLTALATTTVGQASAGTLGGTAGNRLITGIIVPAGGAGTGYNFAEAASSSLAGMIYLDVNQNGLPDSNEFGVATLVVTLSGTTATGQPVSLTTTTDASGHYQFTGLATGTYQIQVAQPTRYFDPGTITPGTAGGTVRNGVITAINFTSGTAATGYNFGELTLSNCRLDTPALQPVLQAGPVGTLPPSFRPVALPANGPIARFLPTLAAQATGQTAVATQGTHALHHKVTHAAKVKVQHGKAKPKVAVRRHK